MEREAFLLERLERDTGPEERFIAAFQRPPLYSPHFAHGFGTLYTAVYRPRPRTLELHWPGSAWRMGINRYHEGVRTIEYMETAPAAAKGHHGSFR